MALYLNPPQHAAVFCVDENTTIHTLDNKVPMLPLSPERTEWYSFEYYWHGTFSLHAAIPYLNQLELWFTKIERDVIGPRRLNISESPRLAESL